MSVGRKIDGERPPPQYQQSV